MAPAPTTDDFLKDLRGDHEYDTNNWQDIRDEAKKDMRFVAGDPWDDDDKQARKNRPTVAPEEMSQYRNQVINSLMANPRGAKFSAVGNGANDKGSQFYQNKWREVEYRSHAIQAYIIAADNALQRSYGFCRVNVGYESPRSANQDITIEAFPNPDMVMPDSDALRYDSADMKRCWVSKWMDQAEFKRKYKGAKVTNFGETSTLAPQWVKGSRVLVAEAWRIKTRPRQLVLVQLPAPAGPPRQFIQAQNPGPRPIQVFRDELAELQKRAPGLTVLRDLRHVDYPEVFMYLTNGLEVLGDPYPWLGKYIPIVSCYGKVLYTEGDAGMERKIMSMTRFGRDPWKSYCYACSQELEIIAQVPKASVIAAVGQLRGQEKDWREAPHVPKPFLYYHKRTDETGQEILGPPERLAYMQGDNLQALEMVKEGFRRAIQSAMGSNFLPTSAQRRNEKSGVALDKIDQMATQGTYHFVYAYEGMIRQLGVIGEDLMDKVYDYTGEVGTMEADGRAVNVKINDTHPEAVNTKGDYLVTVSTAPSSDSEREAAAEFTDTLIGKIELLAGICGKEVAAAIFAKAIRMRNLGPMGDQLADLIEPPEFQSKDGQPPNPQVLAAQAQIKHLTGLLQQAAQEKQCKVVENQGKFAIEQMKVEATTADKAADREVKLAQAELLAKVDRISLFLEESRLVGARTADAATQARDQAHETIQARQDRAHALLMSQQAAQQTAQQSAQDHGEALAAGQQAHGQAVDMATTQAALAPPPDAGAPA